MEDYYKSKDYEKLKADQDKKKEEDDEYRNDTDPQGFELYKKLLEDPIGKAYQIAQTFGKDNYDSKELQAKVIPIFLYGALAGAVFYILSYNLIPGLREDLIQSKALGASAGVMAIAIAATALAPGYRIFPLLNGGIPLWVITGIFVIIDLATIPDGNSGGHIAHLAGAGMGYLFVVMMRRGSDWGKPINNFFDWANNLFNPDKPKKGKTVKGQFYYKTTVPPYKRTSTTITQQRVDAILDKIGQKGYESLTDEEKEILKRASKEDQ